MTVSQSPARETAHDSKAFGILWQKLPSTLLRPAMRFYDDCAYLFGVKISSGSSSNMLSFLSSLLKVMLISTRLYSLGPIVRAHRLYHGLYKHNHHPEYRSSVEHFFGILKLSLPPILDRLP
ncbi:MAG: hypothetical protein ACTSYD_01690, partial [Candidatus Heimdallarchaeaceae archaeon]